ncbi:27617_t:CDS:1, partial [Gigaspora margarita]
MSEHQTSVFVNRACAFINSGNDPVIQSQVINDSQLIKIPFPPEIKSQDLVILHPDGRVPKPPNAFMIYRKLFVETARAGGYNLPMSIISPMASRSWEQESEEVKNEYKRIVKEAFNYRNELFPKSKPQRKKKEKWKFISFDKPSARKVKNPKSMRSANKSAKHQFESFTSKQVTPDESSELLDDLNDIDINPPIFNLDLFAGWTEFLNNQNTYPSPDLSIISSSDSSPNSNDLDLSIQADQQ